MATCGSCPAEIVWAETERGRRIPLDARPVADGNLALVDGVALAATKAPSDAPRYRSHFVSCPNAERHRRRR